MTKIGGRYVAEERFRDTFHGVVDRCWTIVLMQREK